MKRDLICWAILSVVFAIYLYSQALPGAPTLEYVTLTFQAIASGFIGTGMLTGIMGEIFNG